MEPSDASFDQTNTVYDSHGNIVLPPAGSSLSSQCPSSQRSQLSTVVQSVYLAEGIHHQLDEDDLEDLPRRYEAGSSKARLTWFGALCMAGVGMFVEAYIIITTGQVKSIWHSQYPTCFVPDEVQQCPNLIECCDLFPNTPFLNETNATATCDFDANVCNADGTYPETMICDPAQISGAVSSSEFAGIMVGMLVFGKIADLTGRAKAGVLTSVFMVIGISFMTFYDHEDLSHVFIIFSIFFGFLGVGVGGEYPLTASAAAAHHAEAAEEALLDSEERHRYRVLRDHERTARRGETISIVFAMQGVGSVVGSLFLLFFIYFAGQTHASCDSHSGANSSGNDPKALNAVWRGLYLIGGIFIMMLLAYRALIVEEGKGHQKLVDRKKRREEALAGKRVPGTWKVLQFYAPRLLGTGGSWFVWDIAFYGLKLFSGPIFAAFNPSGDLVVQNGYLLLNNLIALVGYYAAAAVIDKPQVGRKRLQMFSFSICSILFLTTAAIFDTGSPELLMGLYFASSFFGNFGANVTTYVMAAETYPTEVRATCHGLSAFAGKMGAFLATLVFSSATTTEIFWICGAVSGIGLVFTLLFSVDLTHVSLAEHDAQLELLYEGTPEVYKGKLNAPEHLSNWEIWTGRHGEFDPKWANVLIEERKQAGTDSNTTPPQEQALSCS